MINKYHWWYALIIILFAVIVRSYFVLNTDFPLGDGGLFYTMSEDLLNNNFKIPRFTTYNNDSIPFAYSPFPFYVVATLHSFLHIPLLEIFRFLPLITTILTLPFFYLLSLSFLSSTPAALFALFFFVTTPRSFQSLILGGGLTRSFGLLFCFAALYFTYKLFVKRKNIYVLLAMVCFAFSLLSHIESAFFTALAIVLMYFVYDRSLGGFFKTAFIGLGGLMIAAPWWATVLAYHGIMPFISALQSNPRSLFAPDQLVFLMYIAEPKIQILYSFAVLGLYAAIVKKKYFPVLWILLISISATKQIHTYGFVPLTMLAGLCITEIVFPSIHNWTKKDNLILKHKAIIVFLIVCSAIFSLITTFSHELDPFDTLPREERIAMEWVKKNTQSSDKFIVVSAFPYWAWFIDTTLEWFPTLATRQSLGTVQGYEWHPGFTERLSMNQNLKKCNNEDVKCLEEFASKSKRSFSHIYVSKKVTVESGWPDCCTLLIDSLHRSSKYKLIYNGAGAFIWEKKYE